MRSTTWRGSKLSEDKDISWLIAIKQHCGNWKLRDCCGPISLSGPRGLWGACFGIVRLMKPGFKTVCRASLILGIGLLSGSALWSQQKKTLSPIEQVNAL